MDKKEPIDISQFTHLSKRKLYGKIIFWVFLCVLPLELVISWAYCWILDESNLNTFYQIVLFILLAAAMSILVTMALIFLIRWIIATHNSNTITRSDADHNTLTELYKAVENSDLSIYYQPQVCLKTGNIVGMETLLRWNHSELGFIPPEEFIPLAEQSGLIVPIGNWVLKVACQQNKTWLDLGFDLKVAVNLSAKQFTTTNIVKNIANILAETQLPARNLELEITETSIIDNLDLAIDIMHKLRALGVTLSMDDFGTGYSSLSSLDRFPIHKLKIDRTFVSKIKKNNHEQNLADGIITIGHSLDLIILAEGIETEFQRDYFVQRNCDEGQGFYFGQPLPASEFIKLLGY